LDRTSNFSNTYELTEAIRSGDQVAFRFLVDTYQKRIIRVCRGFVHSPADAEDIAQDVFIEIYKSISGFRNESELSTWIYRITVNKSLNHLKSSARRKIISFFEFYSDEKQNELIEPAAPPEYFPDEDMKRSELADTVKNAIDGLPLKQRTALILSRYEELSYQEIADVMNLPVPSVESLLFRAKQNLRKKLLVFYKKYME
jgi:RNA polymerase sigma-70 factor, ECF subfamily